MTRSRRCGVAEGGQVVLSVWSYTREASGFDRAPSFGGRRLQRVWSAARRSVSAAARLAPGQLPGGLVSRARAADQAALGAGPLRPSSDPSSLGSGRHLLAYQVCALCLQRPSAWRLVSLPGMPCCRGSGREVWLSPRPPQASLPCMTHTSRARTSVPNDCIFFRPNSS